MATAKKTEIPVMKEITVSYSAGVKCNLGHNTFESASFQVSRTEKYDVSEMSDEAIELFWGERYGVLKTELDEIAVGIHQDTSGIVERATDDN